MNTIEDRVRSGFRPFKYDAELGSILKAAERRRTRAKTLTGAAVAAVVAITVTAGVVLTTPEAHAYWAPIPATPDTELVETAAELCASQIPFELPPLLLVDQRADAARAVFAERGTDANDPTSTMSVCTLIKTDGQWAAPPPNEVPFEAHTMAGDADIPGVAAVAIDQIDGVRVEAAFKDGFYHFWWINPDSFPGGTMLMLDKAGNTIESAQLQGLPPTPGD